jgi:YD repeat-containing protein
VVRQRSGGASDPWTQFYYDAQSRLTRVDSPFADGGSTATTYFSYDVWGNRILVTDPANKATSFTYDTENRLSRVRDAADGPHFLHCDR